jgi:hypothetical protein
MKQWHSSLMYIRPRVKLKNNHEGSCFTFCSDNNGMNLIIQLIDTMIDSQPTHNIFTIVVHF